ncbi:MAG: amidohydrolase [Kiritimatiellae bacterium]|nr:amidohydrolase [Kiritimatiellia bacterium]
MRIVDCHIHAVGETNPNDLLRQMDETGIDRVLILSKHHRTSLEETRANLLETKKLFDAAPDRIGGLAYVNPTIPGVTALTRDALSEMGYTGVKIIPDHWFAYEERLEPFWEKMNELGASILFHTGILYGNDDGSRFCQPVYLEKLLWYPRIRFGMAHISWPWCEECLAVMGRMRAAAGKGHHEWQSYIDLTPGTPPHIRKQAVANAISFCGPERIMWGSDGCVPDRLGGQRRILESDLKIFDELGLDEKQKEQILSGTADSVFPAGA